MSIVSPHKQIIWSHLMDAMEEESIGITDAENLIEELEENGFKIVKKNSVHNPEHISEEMTQAALNALQEIGDSQGDDERDWATSLCMKILTLRSF